MSRNASLILNILNEDKNKNVRLRFPRRNLLLRAQISFFMEQKLNWFLKS